MYNLHPPMDRKQRRREQTIKILKMVAVGALLVGIGAVPPPWAIPRIIKELTSVDTPETRRRTRQRIHDLKRGGSICVRNRRYELTDKGRKIVDEMALWNLQIPQPTQWAGTWYLVAFDIPSKKSRVRIPFVRHLQNLGLVRYQRSVWIYPHPMEKIVRTVVKYFNIEAHVSFITATQIDGTDSLRHIFKVVVR